jgi:glycosyltransferase involved in cell wall biosynthesis
MTDEAKSPAQTTSEDAMYIVDITTMANYFGRITGITRTEHEIARQFMASHTQNTRFVYWSNDKSCFEEYRGPLDFAAVKTARLSRDFSINRSGFTRQALCDLPSLATDAPDQDDRSRALIVSGSGWLQNRHYLLGCLDLARRHQMRLVIYLHDLIPALFPYFYEDAYVAKFLENLRIITGSGALIACNSRNTQADYHSWCADQGLEAPTTCIAYLGDSFTAPNRETADNLPAVPPGPFVLAVGAIHRRKNYALLVQVWRRLAAQMGQKCPSLVIAGGVTKDGKALEAEIKADPLSRRYITILPAISDAELAALYGAAALVVYPSLYEGWGLPVAEALAHGRVCLASNTSAIPEIADLGGDFLPPDDVPGWVNRIQFYMNSDSARSAREAQLSALYRPRDWATTVATLTQALQDHPIPGLPQLYVGEALQFRKAEAGLFLANPLFAVEAWGAWVQGRHVQLRFGCDATSYDKALTLQLKLQFPDETPFDVTLNQQPLGRYIAPAGPTTYSIALPPGLLADRNLLEITTENATRIKDSPRKLWARRHSGVGLVSLALLSAEHLRYEAGARSTRGRGLISLLDSTPNTSPPRTIRVVKTGREDQALASGHIALHLTRPMTSPSPNAPPLPCLIALKAEAVGPVRLLVRQNGAVVQNRTAMVRRDGRLPFWLDLTALLPDAETAIDHPDLEMFLFDADTFKPIKIQLLSFCGPSDRFELSQTQILKPLSPLHAGEFYKFGVDCPDAPNQIFHAGWALARDFGVETLGGAALITAICQSEAPVTRIKLNCKLRDAKTAFVRFIVNGISHEVAMTAAMDAIFLPFTTPLESGDLVSVAVWIEADEPEVVLRSLQLI